MGRGSTQEPPSQFYFFTVATICIFAETMSPMYFAHFAETTSPIVFCFFVNIMSPMYFDDVFGHGDHAGELLLFEDASLISLFPI